MIENYQIILGTFVSNMDSAGYTPVAKAAIKSWCSVPFCDSVLIVDGQSIDNTQEIICNLDEKKINIHTSRHQWLPNSWTWEDIRLIETECIFAVNNIECEHKIYMWLPVDTIIGINSHDEIYDSILSLINNENLDYLLWGWRKAFTTDFMSNIVVPCSGSWYMQSITKFRPNIAYGEVPTETTIESNRKIAGKGVTWRNPPICYDMFMFTKEQLEHKLSRHCGTADNLKDFSTWLNIYITKYNSKGLFDVTAEQHPAIAKETFIKDLCEKHFGMNMFGYKEKIKSRGKLI